MSLAKIVAGALVAATLSIPVGAQPKGPKASKAPTASAPRVATGGAKATTAAKGGAKTTASTAKGGPKAGPKATTVAAKGGPKTSVGAGKGGSKAAAVKAGKAETRLARAETRKAKTEAGGSRTKKTERLAASSSSTEGTDGRTSSTDSDGRTKSTDSDGRTEPTDGGTDPTNDPETTTAVDFTDGKVGQKLAKSTNLREKIAAQLTALGYEGDVYQAAYGFKNLGQFQAAVNNAQNQGLSFEQLKTLMTGLAVDADGVILKANLNPDGTVTMLPADEVTNPLPTKSLGQAKSALVAETVEFAEPTTTEATTTKVATPTTTTKTKTTTSSF
jgi:hypothetical protein